MISWYYELKTKKLTSQMNLAIYILHAVMLLSYYAIWEHIVYYYSGLSLHLLKQCCLLGRSVTANVIKKYHQLRKKGFIGE